MPNLNNNCIKIENDNEDNETLSKGYEIHDFEMPNEETGYEVPNENLFGHNDPVDHEALRDDENNNEVLDEDFFDHEIPNEESLNDEVSEEDEEYSDEVPSDEVSEENEEECSDDLSNDENPDKIVDKALNAEQMPSMTSEEFAPYFKNITEALMFCWIQKHNICKLNIKNVMISMH